MVTLVGLPVEILYLIVCSADIRTICNITAISRYLHLICEDQNTWKEITRRDYGKVILPPISISLTHNGGRVIIRRPYLWRDYYKDLSHNNIVAVEVVVGAHKDIVWMKGDETLEIVLNRLLDIAKKYIASGLDRMGVYFADCSSYLFYNIFTKTTAIGQTSQTQKYHLLVQDVGLLGVRSIYINDTSLVPEGRMRSRYHYIIVNKEHYIWYCIEEHSVGAILKEIKSVIKPGSNTYITSGRWGSKETPKLLFLDHKNKQQDEYIISLLINVAIKDMTKKILYVDDA